MMNDESNLLFHVLTFEEGHCERVQHILSVYALSKLIASQEKLNEYQQHIVRAAAILHDVPINLSKKKYADVCKKKQLEEMPSLVNHFLELGSYSPSFREKILNLIFTFPDRENAYEIEHQVLVEADLITKCFEDKLSKERTKMIYNHFKTESGKQIIKSFLKEK